MTRLTIGLIGNPNCGKTTLFNALTDSNQKVGNWPGVTVECESGYFEFEGHQIKVVDLPGIYSVSVANSEGSLDERITAEYLLSDEAKIFINVLDANNLERSLYLTSQLLELNIPIIIVINMMDVARRRKMLIDIPKLSAICGCKVIPLVASKHEGIEELKKAIIASDVFSKKRNSNFVVYPDVINEALAAISANIFESHRYFRAIRFLEDDILVQQIESPETLVLIEKIKKEVKAKLKEDTDILIADTRYGAIHKLIEQILNKAEAKRVTITTYIDRLILNRILGLPIFFLVMYAIFYFAIGIGGIFQNYFQIGSNMIFVQGFDKILTNWHVPVWLTTILVSGIGRGINTTITFIPVLATMFFILGILESSGYMVRAGFVVDRLMRAVGLPGKSFVPMLIGFGCNVPAIMAARTLETQRDRVLTIMMSPFMSCGARLATYAVFTAAFFPDGAQNIVFLLYIIGIVIAVVTGLILRKTLLQGMPSFLIMELPVYNWPKLSSVLNQTWRQLKSFLFKAGKIIIPFCLLISVLNSVEIKTNQFKKESLLAIAGHKITPLFFPMGITEDNWPATVSLISGVISKEIVVATLNTLYNQEVTPESVRSSNTIYGKMFEKFNGSIGAFTYLLFVLLYFPCVPALATMFRELDWRWAGFSVLWNTSLAYGVAVIFYQIATFFKYPFSAVRFIATIIIAFVVVILLMRKYGKGEIV